MLAAREAGKAILDGVYNDVKDLDGFARRVRAGRRDGLRRQDADPPRPGRHRQPGLGAIDDDVEHARRIIAAFDEAVADGRGVVTVDGRMIENLHVANAQRTLAVAEAIAALG